MTRESVGNISRIEGIMDSAAYQKILEEEYLKTHDNRDLDITETIL